MKRAFAFIVLVITSPIWIVPFLIGYLLVDWQDWSDIDGK